MGNKSLQKIPFIKLNFNYGGTRMPIVNSAYRVVGAILIFFVCASPLFSQSSSVNRTFEPIVVTAAPLTPLLNDSSKFFTAYKYNAAADNFIAIPFQIDDVSRDGDFFEETDGLIDSSDQIVFMPGDVGDQATTNKWLNDPNVAQTRVELAISNPAGGQGWVYLFRNVTTKPMVLPYMRYDRGASTTAFSDTIFGTSYTEAHDATGWYTDTKILQSSGGNGRDIFDRRKVRIAGKVTIKLFNFTTNVTLKEDTLTYTGLRFKEGSVRGVRELTGLISLSGNDFVLPFVSQYFPYSNVFSLRDIDIPVIEDNFIRVTIGEIRQSLDLNDRANGMKFYNAANLGGITIDGNDDGAVPDGLTDGLNWMMAVGNPGTVLSLTTVPLLGDSRKLYFKDNAAQDVADSGDKQSYGDFGWRLSTATNITGVLDFVLTTYYLGANQPVSFGEEFKARANSPLAVTATSQQRTGTAVADRNELPNSFALGDAQPNPFWPLRGQVRLSFQIGQGSDSPSLRVYNLLGQEVARFDLRNVRLASDGAAQNLVWDGRGVNGQLLPAGVYFYQLRSGAQVATKKLVLIR